MPLAYTNRMGDTYYLHIGKTKSGRPRYFMARTVGPGALDELPKEFEIAESIKGVGSVRRIGTGAPRAPAADLALVQAELVRRQELVAATKRAVTEVLRRQGFVSAADVLIDMGKLERREYEDWRLGRVPFLERVIHINLASIGLVMRTMAATCRQLRLKESATAYCRWGKGRKTVLRFTKSGDQRLERAYATHFVSRRGEQRAGTPVRRPPAEPRPALQRRAPEITIEQLRTLAADKCDDHLRLRRQLKDGVISEARADALFHELYREVSAAIDCTACGNCCVEQWPLLQKRDVRRLATAMGMAAEDFERTYLRTDEEEHALVFAQRPWPLLADRKCSRYEARPDACRSYPHLYKKDMVGRLWGVVGNAEVCPIVFEVLERLAVALEHEAPPDFGDPDLEVLDDEIPF
jgi:hypothetical protein